MQHNYPGKMVRSSNEGTAILYPLEIPSSHLNRLHAVPPERVGWGRIFRNRNKIVDRNTIIRVGTFIFFGFFQAHLVKLRVSATRFTYREGI